MAPQVQRRQACATIPAVKRMGRSRPASLPAHGADGSTLRVVAVETANPQAYAEQIKKGRAIIAKAVSEWLGGLSGLRTIASDSLYQEIGL